MNDYSTNLNPDGLSLDDLEETKPIDPIVAVDDTLVEFLPVSESLLRVAQRCDIGAVRERNEDSCLVFTAESGGHSRLLPFGLFIVADGMGGHENGHLASRRASRAAAQHVLTNVYLPILAGDTLEASLIKETIADAVLMANTAVVTPQQSDSGTTLTMAVLQGDKLYLAHVGDSRAYWLVDGRLKAITIDHSLVQRLQDEGQLTAEEAQVYQYRNILLRALGQEDGLEVDTYEYTLPTNGKLLLCSDGLCGLVSDAEIERIMVLERTPDRIAALLVEAALDAGGYDNITAVVVDYRL